MRFNVNESGSCTGTHSDTRTATSARHTKARRKQKSCFYEGAVRNLKRSGKCINDDSCDVLVCT